jgi:DNA topoisomerase-2
MSLHKRAKGEGSVADNIDNTKRTRADSGDAKGSTPLDALFKRAASGASSSSSLTKKGSEHVESPPLKKGRSSSDVKNSPKLGAKNSPKNPGKNSPRSGPQPAPLDAPANQGRAGRSVEQTYQKKTQLEHILLRPDSYVGSVERSNQDHWIFDEEVGRMMLNKLEYVPSLYKIFDEILVNAADNLVRSPKQDTIKVEIDAKNGCVSVHNNGSGLPVVMHKEHNCYVPELVFGHLLTSDNYDDDERKVTGGRNGYGAKLTNIFSKKFKLETADTESGKRYSQVWETNMTKRHEPEIKKHTGEDFTCVTFYPDFEKFGMKAFDKDIISLMSRRAYDVAASTHGKCKVFLNGKELSVKSFEDFVALHLQPDAFRVCQVINERWEVGVALVGDGSGFQQVSFVNSISTCRGGTHVNLVADQLINPIMEKMGKVKGGRAVKPQHVRGYLMVFVNCLIENPAFDSQTKETLTSKKDRFGSQCVLPDELIGKVLESGILSALQEWSKALGQSELAQYLNRSDMGLQKRLFGIPKLEDANKAGTKEGGDCTLILTEGDSAKALAVAGLSVIGRDHYGVFPLRGKLRNVRDLTVKQMLENKEIDQIMKIIAMDASKTYDNVKGLRYGSIMIMTDQDHDGSHIKGLIINFLHYWFPSLLQIPGFLKEFVTPIVKVSKGDETQTFFTIPEYQTWKKANDDGKGWKCKYYKGLGTSTSTEAREYFAALEDHEMIFTHEGAEDDDLIDMSFNHSRADDRKTWISRCLPDTYVDHTQATISYNEFVNKELVLFAQYDVERMIPSAIDGFKPGQRKVLFGCFKKRVTSDIKVAQLSGYVAEQSSYHHGETSLQGTIIGLAQTYVGSNNINLLVPSGQFGTRLTGGKDHAAARYIFTRLSKAARCIFPEEDDQVLEYLDDEGSSIEPKYYCPIIPLVAANGATGIGVGWSTSVPNYNPRELIANVRRQLKGEPMQKQAPWYRNFKGTIKELDEKEGKYECCGTAVKRGRTRLEISELPVQRWTQDYKEWLLEQLPKGDDARKATISDVREYHTENSVHFVLSMTPDKLAEADRRGLQKVFHLKSSISTTNMWLFDPNGKIKKYETLEDIIKDFMKVRMGCYKKRKAFMLEKMNRQLDLIDNKLRFVQLVVSETLEVEGRKGKPSAETCGSIV